MIFLNSRYLATASSDHTVKIWNVDGFTLERTLVGMLLVSTKFLLYFDFLLLSCTKSIKLLCFQDTNVGCGIVYSLLMVLILLQVIYFSTEELQIIWFS